MTRLRAVTALAIASVWLAAPPSACGTEQGCLSDAALVAALAEYPAGGYPLPGGGQAAFAATKERLLSYDGCRVRSLPYPPAGPSTVRHIWAFGPANVWAITSGTGGSGSKGLARWNGKDWEAIPGFGSAPDSAPLALWASGPNDLWIAGGSPTVGEIFHWDGRQIRRVDLGPKEKPPQLTTLGGIGRTDLWAASSDSEWILHGDRKTWARQTTPFAFHPAGFAARRPGEPWATGLANTNQPNVFRWDGHGWRAHALAPGSIVDLAAAGSVVFVSTREGSILAPDRDGEWRALFAFGAAGNVTNVFPRGPDSWGIVGNLHLTSERRGFALGMSNQRLMALRWDGESWNALGPTPGEVVTALWSDGGAEVWAATAATWHNGRRPLGAVLRWDGKTWQRVGTAGSRLLEITARAPGEMWAVGQAGAVIRCDPRSCASVPSGTDEALVGVWSQQGRLWAGGEGGTLLEWDGRAFQRRAPPRGWKLFTVWSAGDRRVWGAGSEVLRWSGKGWATPGDINQHFDESRTSIAAYAGCGLGASDVWIAGARSYHDRETSTAPMVMHWDGKTWTFTDAQVRRVTCMAGSMWATGLEGLLWRRKGNDWERLDSGTRETIWSAVPAGADVWIAAGDCAVPLRIRPKPFK